MDWRKQGDERRKGEDGECNREIHKIRELPKRDSKYRRHGDCRGRTPGWRTADQARAENVTLGPTPQTGSRKESGQPQKTITQMEKLSRQILFETLPDTGRRKSLPKKVLGLS